MKTEKSGSPAAARRGATELPTPAEAAAAFEPALGHRQARVRAALQRMATAPPQVLLLEGGTAEERYATALWYTAALNCRARPLPCLHCPDCLKIGAEMFPDLSILDGRQDSIKIEAVRELRVVLGEAPRGEGTRVIVLAEAQSLGTEAANALLKSLEEPRPGVCFLLLAPQRECLLPTLVSRGWTLTLPWPNPAASAPDALAPWEQALAVFLESGRGWFERTGAKGSVDAALARQILLLVQKALAATTAGRDGGRLGAALAALPAAGRLYTTDLLNQCGQSLAALVNPALVLDWLATRLYLACRCSRKQFSLQKQVDVRTGLR